jgi:uncharacterized membrane protein
MVKTSQCTLGASVLSFIMVTKLTALDSSLTTQITKMLPSAMTVRTTTMVGRELIALIELLLVVSLQGRINVHTHLLFFLMLMAISLNQATAWFFISFMPGVITSVLPLLLTNMRIRFNKT